LYERFLDLREVVLQQIRRVIDDGG